ncbi:hypothetical protein CC117_17570 [Parafrankia colletiae]|uniref:Uncharacterized protein n=2 Tax=Parafrankia colletiae TaxID=573497 RepID=A0A1S1QSK6_9ACTN|nr:hypothetical protein CC117_17570 [Parafrankia colletiae]
MSRLSRSLALVLLFAGLALGQIAARLSDHRAISLALSLLGLLCLAGMLLVFVVQGWREPQGRPDPLDRSDHADSDRAGRGRPLTDSKDPAGGR